MNFRHILAPVDLNNVFRCSPLNLRRHYNVLYFLFFLATCILFEYSQMDGNQEEYNTILNISNNSRQNTNYQG